MPDFRFVCAKSTTQPTSGYASRISLTAWLQHEDNIRLLHNFGHTREEILRVLVNDHQFQPSTGQLRDQMARWGLRAIRKSNATSGADKGRCSSTTLRGSEVLQMPSACFQSKTSTHMYSDVLDETFTSMWPLHDVGSLPYQTVIQMETLADVLFLGGRYVAAFNLYASVYDATCCTSSARYTELVATRFRALVGCLRSSGNSDQRLRIVSIADQVLKKSSTRGYCKLGDIDLRQGVSQRHGPLMAHFHNRERFRNTMAMADSVSTVDKVVEQIQIDESQPEVLEWCFDRLNTPAFISTYNEHLCQTGSGVAAWTYGDSQNAIYWYLVIDAMGNFKDNLPRFTITLASGHKHTFSICSTFAIVAAMVSSEPWLFSLDQLPPEGLLRWTETLATNESVFDAIFQHAIRTTMVPGFATRLNKTKSDALAAANGHPVCRMPNTDVLKLLAAEINETRMAKAQSHRETDMVETDGSVTPDMYQLEFDCLTRQYANTIRSYVSENCAYGTSYQLNGRSREDSRTTIPAVSVKYTPIRSFSGRR